MYLIKIIITWMASRGFSLSLLSPPFLRFLALGSFPPGIVKCDLDYWQSNINTLPGVILDSENNISLIIIITRVIDNILSRTLRSFKTLKSSLDKHLHPTNTEDEKGQQGQVGELQGDQLNM